MIPGGDEHRRAAGHLERLERERQRVGVDADLVEEIARQKNGVRAALDRLLHRSLQRLALVAPATIALLGREPAEWAAEVEVGDLKQTHQAHAFFVSSLSTGA